MAKQSQGTLSNNNLVDGHFVQGTTSNKDLADETLTGKLPYTLTNDFFFKAFLQRNEIALKGLLSALLSIEPEKITSITITNPIKEGELVDDKSVILDINLVLNNNQIINLEMQVANVGNWSERSLTYLCRMFDHLKAGEDYLHVKKTIHIGIMDFTPNGFPKTLYSEYYLYNPKTKHKYSDKFGIHMLQLNQIGNRSDEQEMPALYYWAQLFKATTWEEIQMVAEKNEFIKQSIVTLKELTADEEAKMQMEARERYRRDWEAGMELIREESREEIEALQNDLQKSQNENSKLQAENSKIQKEKEECLRKAEEEIRILKEQLAKANQK